MADTPNAGYEFRDIALDQTVRADVELAKKLLAVHEWEQAAAKAATLARNYADSRHVQELLRDVRTSREKHKLHLINRFLTVAHLEDPDEAMALLKRMDRLLTAEEAGPITALASKVIERYKQRLINRFHIAIDVKDWIQATEVAERIVENMPNTRAAAEVSQRMTILRQRSLQQKQTLEKA